MKYNATITKIGNEAKDFLEKSGSLIIFGGQVPPELETISLIHDGESLTQELKVGDMVMLCGKELYISAIGNKAIENIKKLGHCTLRFDAGGNILPGNVILAGEAIAPGDIVVGGKLEFH